MGKLMYHFKRITQITILIFLSISFSSAQVVISGIVEDIESKSPLIGATVQVKESFIGTTTGLDGSFTLQTQETPKMLVISYVGYSPQEVAISDNLTNIVVALSSKSFTTNEVIVTAQHRDQILQEVPMSIAVIDQTFLKRSSEMNEIEDLVGYAPGLTGKNLSTSQANYTIRGIGTNVFGIGAEASVGIFSDGMYNGRTAAAGLAFFDAERIEVLKGPQGTLFGRNASAGVVSIHSNKPQFKKLLELGGHFGNWGQLEGNYIVNLPLEDKFAVRLAGKVSQRDGLRSLSNQDDYQLADINTVANRLSLLFKPSSKVNFTLRLEQTNLDGGGIATKSTNEILGATTDKFEREFESDFKPEEKTERYAANLTGNFVLNDNLSLQSITAYNNTEQNYEQDTDGSPVYILNYQNPMEATNFLQEFRLKGNSEKFNWMVATSIFKEELKMGQTVTYDDATIEQVFFVDDDGNSVFTGDTNYLCIDNPDCISDATETVDDTGDYTGYSVYGNATYALTEKLSLTAGLRYSYDEKDFTTKSDLGTGFLHGLLQDNFILGPTADTSNSETYSDVQPRIALDYKINDNTMVYASYNKGFKTGGFNTFTAAPFESETNNAYEVGMKSSFADNRVKFNITGYFSDYSNLQVLTIENAIVRTTNAGSVESKGVEIETSFNLAIGFDVKANVALNDAEYKDYSIISDTGVEDFTGNIPNRSPETSFSIIGQYVTPMSFGDLVIRADYVYQSEEYYTRENLDIESSDAYGLFNAQIGVENLFKGKVNLTLFGTNLADEDYIVYAEDLVGFGALYAPGIPRLVGLKFRLNNIFNW